MLEVRSFSHRKHKTQLMKLIKVKIKNKWLNALEDLIFCELNEKEFNQAKKESKKLWLQLVKEYDAKKIKA